MRYLTKRIGELSFDRKKMGAKGLFFHQPRAPAILAEDNEKSAARQALNWRRQRASTAAPVDRRSLHNSAENNP
jgi:hypothetical protein